MFSSAELLALASMLVPAIVSYRLVSTTGLSVLTVLSQTASGINIQDTGTAAGCTGGTACCIPSCTVQVSDVNGCSSGSVGWTGNCKSNYDNPSGTQDIGGCKGYEMSWSKSLADKTTPVVVVRKKSDGSTDTFAVQNCKQASEGGHQCAPTDGGCVSSFPRNLSLGRACLGVDHERMTYL